jgi:hypothetical protein
MSFSFKQFPYETGLWNTNSLMSEGRKLELATTLFFILRSDGISLKEGSIRGMKGNWM